MNSYEARAGAPAKSHSGRSIAANDIFDIRIREAAELAQVWQRMVLHLLRSNDLSAPWVLGITSAIRGEGKSTNTLGMALSLAQETSEKVLVIETDFYNPTMMADFQITRRPSLADFLSNAVALDAVVSPTATRNLFIIPAWDSTKDQLRAPASTFSAALRHRMPELMDHVRQRFQYVFVDMAGLLEDVNAEEIARHTDGVLLVVRAGVTPVGKVMDAAQLLDPHSIRGVIHIGPDSPMPRWLSALMTE